MKSFIALIAVLVSSPAFAAVDYVCESAAGDLRVRIAGTGSADGAVMVISNPQISSGRKTIARFTEANGTLEVVSDFRYTASVDLRFTDSSRRGELLAGTKLGEVDELRFIADSDGESSARLIVVKRNGRRATVGLDCTN